MFTRCPECHAVHALDAAALARASGAVRCGECDTTYDALSSLFDYRPASDTPALEPGAGPAVLGKPADVVAPEAGGPDALGDATGTHAYRQKLWLAAFLVLAVLTVVNLAWTFREPVMSAGPIRGALTAIGLVAAEPERPFRDPSRIHLVSRDMHTHPSREGLLVLSIVFVNRADQPQPYPDIRLTLTGAANEPLAQRRFEPAAYLAGGPPAEPLAPMVHVPVLLEFADPGEKAIGFELEFE